MNTTNQATNQADWYGPIFAYIDQAEARITASIHEAIQQALAQREEAIRERRSENMTRINRGEDLHEEQPIPAEQLNYAKRSLLEYLDTASKFRDKQFVKTHQPRDGEMIYGLLSKRMARIVTPGQLTWLINVLKRAGCITTRRIRNSHIIIITHQGRQTLNDLVSGLGDCDESVTPSAPPPGNVSFVRADEVVFCHIDKKNGAKTPITVTHPAYPTVRAVWAEILQEMELGDGVREPWDAHTAIQKVGGSEAMEFINSVPRLRVALGFTRYTDGFPGDWLTP